MHIPSPVLQSPMVVVEVAVLTPLTLPVLAGLVVVGLVPTAQVGLMAPPAQPIVVVVAVAVAIMALAAMEAPVGVES